MVSPAREARPYTAGCGVRRGAAGAGERARRRRLPFAAQAGGSVLVPWHRGHGGDEPRLFCRLTAGRSAGRCGRRSVRRLARLRYLAGRAGMGTQLAGRRDKMTRSTIWHDGGLPALPTRHHADVSSRPAGINRVRRRAVARPFPIDRISRRDGCNAVQTLPLRPMTYTAADRPQILKMPSRYGEG